MHPNWLQRGFPIIFKTDFLLSPNFQGFVYIVAIIDIFENEVLCLHV
jgi:hypothetical protein